MRPGTSCVVRAGALSAPPFFRLGKGRAARAHGCVAGSGS